MPVRLSIFVLSALIVVSCSKYEYMTHGKELTITSKRGENQAYEYELIVKADFSCPTDLGVYMNNAKSPSRVHSFTGKVDTVLEQDWV